MRRGGRPNAHAFIGQTHVLSIGVRRGMHDHCFNAELAAGALNAQCNFASVGDEDFSEHEGS